MLCVRLLLVRSDMRPDTNLRLFDCKYSFRSVPWGSVTPLIMNIVIIWIFYCPRRGGDGYYLEQTKPGNCQQPDEGWPFFSVTSLPFGQVMLLAAKNATNAALSSALQTTFMQFIEPLRHQTGFKPFDFIKVFTWAAFNLFDAFMSVVVCVVLNFIPFR